MIVHRQTLISGLNAAQPGSVLILISTDRHLGSVVVSGRGCGLCHGSGIFLSLPM